MPNVEKDARAAAWLGWVHVARNSVVVVYDDPPAVRLTGVPHVLRAVPVGSGDRAVHDTVLVLRARVVDAFDR